jgi:hypothetical protein
MAHKVATCLNFLLAMPHQWKQIASHQDKSHENGDGDASAHSPQAAMEDPWEWQQRQDQPKRHPHQQTR